MLKSLRANVLNLLESIQPKAKTALQNISSSSLIE
jgi:hypothetical protein